MGRKQEANTERHGQMKLHVYSRELHGDGDDGITAVMGLDFMMDTATPQ